MLCAHSFAADEIVTENGKAYRLHKVEKGEGLYRLSVNNNTTQEALILANPQLRETGLVVGSTIRIPLSNHEMHNLPQGDYVTHVVSKGETAFSVAQKYGMKLGEFFASNPGSENGLNEGQSVRVRSSNGKVMTYRHHTIAAGETLYSIGVKYGVKPEAIVECNHSLNVQSLPIGTVIRIPDTKIPAEDDHYYYHHIAAGETLYSLCVRYNLLQEKIMAANPDINWHALSIGQVVAIPKAYATEVWKEHKVRKRETLYGILKEYGISEEELRQWNPQMGTRGLEKDMVLRILDREAMKREAPATTDPLYVGSGYTPWVSDAYNYVREGRPTINVGLMLPFDAENEMRQRREAGKTGEGEVYYFKTRRYIEFYEGVRMAVDSLVRAGANISLNVYDASSALKVTNLTDKAELKLLDLIIGPSHLDRMRLASDFSRQNHIPIVFPFAPIDAELAENPYAFQANTIDTITGLAILEQMVQRSIDKKMIIITPDNANKMEAWRTAQAKLLCDSLGVEHICLRYNPTAPQHFIDALSTTKENTLLMPTNNEAKINSVVVSIASVMSQKPEAKITLMGFGEWLQFQTIEVDVFHKLNTTIIATFGLDYSDAYAQRIMSLYRKDYFAEPVAFTPSFQGLKDNSGFSRYALWGYDVALKFIGARLAYGPNFERRINDFKPHLVQSNFSFQHVTNWGGAVNVGLKVTTFGTDNSIRVEDVK